MRTAAAAAFAALFALAAGTPRPGAAAEVEPGAFKGPSTHQQLDVSVLTGLGIIGDATAAYQLGGALSRRIVERGFVPDINDQVFIEGQLAALLYAGTSALAFSLHLRWDFRRDDRWRLYALGGLGGNVVSGGRVAVFPRLGAGFMRDLPSIQEGFFLRGELSHEAILAGVGWGF